MQLSQLMYMSSAVELFDEKMLEELLEAARSRNEEMAVTGLLIYVDGSFLQIIEGPPPAVDAVYTAILKDPRHRNVLEMFNREIEERSFPDWSMAFARSDIPSNEGRQAFRKLRGDVLANAGYIKGPNIIPHIVSAFVRRTPSFLEN